MSETYRIDVLSKEREVLMAVCENHVEGGIWARVYNLDSAFKKIVEAKPVTPVDAQPATLTEDEIKWIKTRVEWGIERQSEFDTKNLDTGEQTTEVYYAMKGCRMREAEPLLAKLRTQQGVVLTREQAGQVSFWLNAHPYLSTGSSEPLDLRDVINAQLKAGK